METSRQKHILLLDELHKERKTLTSLLRANRFRVSYATSTKQGYMMAVTLQPDLILIQTSTSTADSFSIFRRLHETVNYQLPAVIVLAGSSTLEVRLEAFRLGAVDFITNPCAPEEVLARIHAQLRHEREMREMRESNNDNVLQPPQSESEVLLSAAVRQIKEDLAAPISLKALARSIGSNEKQLTQLFRERLGLTVFAYIRQLRLQQAKRLLAESQLSVESIAAQVGYSSAANFATAFKAHETMTPSEFRQQQSAPQPDDQVFASCSASATSI